MVTYVEMTGREERDLQRNASAVSTLLAKGNLPSNLIEM